LDAISKPITIQQAKAHFYLVRKQININISYICKKTRRVIETTSNLEDKVVQKRVALIGTWARERE